MSDPMDDVRIYREKGAANYSPEVVRGRQQWLERRCGVSLEAVSRHGLETPRLMGHIENPVGAVQVPLAVAGPLLVNGEHARGAFYVPMATTEGALVGSYQRGMNAISAAGGVTVRVLRNETHICPVFVCDDLKQSIALTQFVAHHFDAIKAAAESTTRHGELLRVDPILAGRRAHFKFVYSTGDAMGLNMINIATHAGCAVIREEFPGARYFLRSNYSSDKKASFANYISSYGREVVVDGRISEEVLRQTLGEPPSALEEFWNLGVVASSLAGVVGISAHSANGLTAIFIACGQDPAQVVNSAATTLTLSTEADGSLYMSLRMPSLLVGTVGGGTSLPTQRECLQLMDCHGSARADKFAEIVAATVLAGELSICAALTSSKFVEAHRLTQQLANRSAGS